MNRAPNKTKYQAYGLSSIGQCRPRNEDSFRCDTHYGTWLVADGVGGNTCGDIASKLVTDELPRLLKTGLSYRHAIACIHKKIKLSSSQGIGAPGMATTLVLAQTRDSAIDICWVGDSRAYLVSDSSMQQLTKDHSLYQRFIDLDFAAENQALMRNMKNILTQCVGSQMSEIYPDQTTVKLKPGDKLLLCSDGLYNELEPTELTKIIVSSMSLEKAVTELIDAANNNGGLDNITAILIEKDN